MFKRIKIRIVKNKHQNQTLRNLKYHKQHQELKVSLQNQIQTSDEKIALRKNRILIQTQVMVTKNRLLGIVFALGLLTGCENAPTFEKSYVFDKSEWAQNVKPSFTVDIQDVSKEYNFILTIRTTTEYKFSNLWMYMSTTTPKGDKAREPFELIIANQDGSWAGTKTGTVVETSLQFKRRKMPEKGKYTFVLEQGITESKIDEILDVTLLVEEAVKEN
ncbi:MAG: hypothetical protein E6Q38_00790 [Crocinitomicaceae bacterium]|nr:MAG: hypothetical protein E6Q38_00790 [Crocinitomicaceae bacterium]